MNDNLHPIDVQRQLPRLSEPSTMNNATTDVSDTLRSKIESKSRVIFEGPTNGDTMVTESADICRYIIMIEHFTIVSHVPLVRRCDEKPGLRQYINYCISKVFTAGLTCQDG